MSTDNHAAPIWLDLAVADLDRAGRFYGELFGWKLRDDGERLGYDSIIQKDGRDLGGVTRRADNAESSVPHGFTLFLSTDDAQVTAERAIAAGGTLVMPPLKVGEQGTMLGVLDPSGAYVGAWQPGEHAGFASAPGAPGWTELMTTGFDAATQFYRDVFAFENVAMEGMRYATDRAEDQATYGICDGAPFLAEGVSSYWRLYFSVADADAAASRVESLGGEVLDGPTDSPFGRLATVTDDQGAGFQIIASTNDDEPA